MRGIDDGLIQDAKLVLLQRLAQSQFELVPLLGLPVASALYAGVLMVRARAGYLSIALSTVCLGLLQIWLLSIAVDIRGEPIVRGWLFSLFF